MQKKEGQVVLFFCSTRALHLNVLRVPNGKDVILHIFARYR